MIPLFKVFMSPNAGIEVQKVLESGYIGQGEKVEQFEHDFAVFVESEDNIPLSMNSCTSSLDLALHLIGVKAGDDVISTSITCTGTNGVIHNRGANIIWADVDQYTGRIDPKDVANKITPKTKAIMAVDWGGISCDYDALKRFNIPVIEDAAHALGAYYQGQSITKSGGDYVAWSFQAIKHLTTGDGGALLAPKVQMERGRLLRWYGLDRRSSQSFRCSQTIHEIGYKYHMTDIVATIGISNLKYMKSVLEITRFNAATYCANLYLDNIIVPEYTKFGSWWLYTIIVPDQQKFIKFMMDNGIETSPVHARNDKHPPLKYGVKHGDLPGVDFFAEHEVAIPVGWWLSHNEKDKIIDLLYQWDKRC